MVDVDVNLTVEIEFETRYEIFPDTMLLPVVTGRREVVV